MVEAFAACPIHPRNISIWSLLSVHECGNASLRPTSIIVDAASLPDLPIHLLSLAQYALYWCHRFEWYLLASSLHSGVAQALNDGHGCRVGLLLLLPDAVIAANLG